MIIPGFSEYDITEDGVVTHTETSTIIKRHDTCVGKGYYYARVSLVGDDGNWHSCNLLQLLALAFLEKPTVPCMAKAKDGNSLNISADNVVWVPYSANVADAWSHGKYAGRKHKCNHCCTKDTIEMVLNALEQCDEPISNAELSRLLDVSYSTVRYTVKALVERGKVKYVAGRGHMLV